MRGIPDVLVLLMLSLAGVAARAAEPLPELQKFHQYAPTLATSGQPKRSQFEAIAKAGYKVVVNVASPDSNPEALGNEKQLVEAAGMEYFLIPIKWAKPDLNQVMEAVNLIGSLEGKPLLMHCYVNSRASLVAYLFRLTRGAVVAMNSSR